MNDRTNIYLNNWKTVLIKYGQFWGILISVTRKCARAKKGKKGDKKKHKLSTLGEVKYIYTNQNNFWLEVNAAILEALEFQC